MRKILFYISVIIVLFATDAAATAQNTLAHSIVRCYDYFLHFNGYDEYILTDVEIIDRGEAIGVVLLSPEGFEQNLVYNVSNMLPIYASARILDVESRDFLMDKGIRMSEVKKLAYAAKMRATELRNGWPPRK